MYDGAGKPIRVKMAEVKAVVAKHNGVTVADLESECRNRSFAWPRQIAQYLCREMTPSSYPEIGRAFGDRDHTSILFAYRKIAHLRTRSTDLEATLEVYRREIREMAEERAAVEDTVRITPASLPDEQYTRILDAKKRARARARRMQDAIDRASWMRLGGEIEAAS